MHCILSAACLTLSFLRLAPAISLAQVQGDPLQCGSLMEGKENLNPLSLAKLPITLLPLDTMHAFPAWLLWDEGKDWAISKFSKYQ